MKIRNGPARVEFFHHFLFLYFHKNKDSHQLEVVRLIHCEEFSTEARLSVARTIDRKCCVPGCVNSKTEVTTTLHKFPNPVKYKQLFNTWLYAIGGNILKLENVHIFKHRRVCQIHFEEKYWCRNNRLSNVALPTKNMPGFKDEKKYAPPCKKAKSNERPLEQRTKSTEQNVTEEQSGKVEENELDVCLSHSDVADPESKPGPFSWHKSLPICVEKDDVITDISEVPVVDLDVENKPNDLNEITEAPSKHDDEEEKYVTEKHAEFSCDHCLGEIIGYTCVQCENYDLCCACEGQLVHPRHYMLRVPKPRPFNEVRSVIAAIRVKLKLLEEAFKQNSGDWSDVMIKKEEDPLEVEETTAPPETTTEQPLEESVVPNFDISDCQVVNGHDLKSPSKDVQDETSHCSPSTPVAENVIQKSTVISKTRLVISGISDNDVIFIQNDEISNTNLMFAQERDVASNTNGKSVKQNTAMSNRDLRLNKESKGVSNKHDKISKQYSSTNLTYFQQKQIIPTIDVIKCLQKDKSSDINRLQDTAMKNDVDLQQAVSNTNVLQANADTNDNEMFVEYLDEVWLDESILAEDNSENKVPETKQNESIIREENIQKDKVTENKEKETIPNEQAETKENIIKHTKGRRKESRILNYEIKEATTSKEDVISSYMLPVGY